MSKPKHLTPLTLLFIILFAASVAACQPEPAPTPESVPAPADDDDELVFGMILVGPRDDHGWSEAHYRAGQYVEANVPDTRMIVLENLNPDARPEMTLETAVHDMIEEGAELIFVTSDDFAADTMVAADHHADAMFVHTTGDHVLEGEAPSNLTNFMPRMVYGKMIAGCAAALATETGSIGYVGPLINDETRRLANAAYIGARHCYEQFQERDPDELQFTVEWIGFWFHIPGVTTDPTAVTNQMFDAGSDVVISGIDTTEVIQVTGERAAAGETVWAVPYDYEDACSDAPAVCLGVPYFNWGPGYVEFVQNVRQGEWASDWEWVEPDWEDLNDPDSSPIGYNKGPGLTGEQSAQLDAFIADLADETVQLFKGPLRYQDRSVFLDAGEVATDEQIWYMPQLLEGMEGLSE